MSVGTFAAGGSQTHPSSVLLTSRFLGFQELCMILAHLQQACQGVQEGIA